MHIVADSIVSLNISGHHGPFLGNNNFTAEGHSRSPRPPLCQVSLAPIAASRCFLLTWRFEVAPELTAAELGKKELG